MDQFAGGKSGIAIFEICKDISLTPKILTKINILTEKGDARKVYRLLKVVVVAD
jgi:hypothetical protein